MPAKGGWRWLPFTKSPCPWNLGVFQQSLSDGWRQMVKAVESLKNQWNLKVKKKKKKSAQATSAQSTWSFLVKTVIMVLKKRPPSKWTSGSTDLYRVSQAPEMHLLGCGLLKLPWITKRPRIWALGLVSPSAAAECWGSSVHGHQWESCAWVEVASEDLSGRTPARLDPAMSHGRETKR